LMSGSFMWRQHSGGNGGWISLTLCATKSKNWLTMVSLSSLVEAGAWMMRLSPTTNPQLINSLGVSGEYRQSRFFLLLNRINSNVFG
jgi:hypothetical protein